MPQPVNSSSSTRRVEPNIARPATIREPALARHAIEANTAAIPVAVAKHASAPSIRRSRSSKADVVGLA